MNVHTVSNIYRMAIACIMIVSGITLTKSTIVAILGAPLIIAFAYLFKRFGFKCEQCGKTVYIVTNVINPENAFDKYSYEKCCSSEGYIIPNMLMLYFVIAMAAIYISGCVLFWKV
jgi:hypothetical protein